MILFRKTRYKNLMSTGNQWVEIRLDKDPTTLITGKNGSGKSTLIEAITLALFNKAYRSVNKPALVNTINNKNCVVEIEFDIGSKSYKVVRGIKPNVFEIWINGELRNSVPGTDDQKFLEEVILQMNYKTFVQLCIIGTATYTPFMQLTTPARRDIIEDLLDIRIFSLMTEVLKKKVSDSKQRIRDLESEISVQTSKIGVQESYVQTLHDDRARKVESIREKIAESQATIDAATVEVDTLMAQRDFLSESLVDSDALDEKFEKLKPLQYKLNDSQARLNKEIAFFEKHDDCPTCLQAIDADFKAGAIDSRTAKSDELGFGLVKLETQLKKLKVELDSIAEVNRNISKLDREIRDKQSSIWSENQYVSKLNKDIEEEQNRSINIDDEKLKLKKLAKEAVALTNSKSEAAEDKFYLDLQAVMLKDTGIKAKVIKQYMPIINKLINKYLVGLDFFASFSLDENFNETIKSRNRDELTYASFSEGEKLKIDMSILFTWITVAKLKNTVATNLLILDEVSDSGLDSVSSGLIVDILKEFSRDSHVFVISHHPELYVDRFDNHIHFEKVNNYSVIKENS